MIWESAPWKDELGIHASQLRKPANLQDINEQEEFRIERSLFLSAFVLRKLIENGKISDQVSKKPIFVQCFPSTKPKAGRLSFEAFGSPDIIGEYDLDNPSLISLSPHKLTGEIIHSHALGWCLDGSYYVESFYVASYRNQEKRVISITLTDYVKLLEEFASDDIISTKSHIDTVTGKVITLRS